MCKGDPGKTLPGRWCSPHLHSVIPTTRGNVAAIRGPRQRIYSIAVSLVGEDSCSRVYIPYLHGVIPAAGSNKLTVGRPGQRAHFSSMSLVGVDNGACVRIPDLHCSVPTGRSNQLTVRGPGQCIYEIAWSRIRYQEWCRLLCRL